VQWFQTTMETNHPRLGELRRLIRPAAGARPGCASLLAALVTTVLVSGAMPPRSGGAEPTKVAGDAAGESAAARRVRAIIQEQWGLTSEDVTPGASLVDDLDADELDFVELVMALEEDFGIEISDEDAEKLVTVRDVVSCVEARMQQAPRLAPNAGAASDYVEPQSKLSLPSVMGGIRREYVKDYAAENGAPEAGVGIFYSTGEVKADVFVYSGGRAHVESGIASAAVRDELAEAKRGIRRQPAYEAVEELGQKTVSLKSPCGMIELLQADFRIRDASGRKRSHLYLTGFADRFLKVRITYVEGAAGAEAARDAYLADLGERIGAAMRSATGACPAAGGSVPKPK